MRSVALGVMIRAEKVQRNIRLITNHPAVMRHRRNVKKLACSQLDHTAIIERSRCSAGEYQSNMLNIAAGCAHARSDVFAPFPARLVRGATDCHPAEMHNLEATLLHDANFVRRLEGFENDRYLLAAHV